MYCVTKYRKSVNVVVKGGSHTYKCRQSQSAVGIRRHILVVVDTIGNLPEFLKLYGQRKWQEKQHANIPKRAGEKSKEKKEEKRQEQC